jgi:glutamate synthase (NADPH) large chain
MNKSEPTQRSLYVPQLESDACGTGLIAQLDGIASHQLIEDALKMLTCMEHRGATGFEENTGDGAGILLQTPHRFFLKKCTELGINLPDFGNYGVGVVFFPQEKNIRNQCRTLLNDYIDEMGFDLLGYRHLPTDHENLGDMAIGSEPRMEQVFVQPKAAEWQRHALERKLYVLRKYATHKIHTTFPRTSDQFYIASFSYKTVLYKGQLTTHQVRPYFTDLHDADFESAIALIHSRFSTNTVPKWKLAQPFRYIAHNGEINTITGNVNWWKSKESIMKSTVFSDDDLAKLFPVCGQALSDSANFDNVLEFLVMNGRSMPHALMMMIPEAWQHDAQMPDYQKDFYAYHENMMEAWDGPAAICFTDGIVVGATLDRNGLRPLRYCITDDNRLIAASEAGALEIPPEKIVKKGRLQAGKMLIADLEEKKLYTSVEVNDIVCQNQSYGTWLSEQQKTLADLPESFETEKKLEFEAHVRAEKQNLFGFTKEDLKTLIQPMLKNGEESMGSMGSDTPLAVLSLRAQHLSNYFKQLFAQVTNPPIDPIRERAVMALNVRLGASENILIPTPDTAHFLALDQPVLYNKELRQLKNLATRPFKGFSSAVLDITFEAEGEQGQLAAAIHHIQASAEDAVRHGACILILSDRAHDLLNAPIPSLLAAGAVHQHLVRVGLRARTSLVVEAGDIWEVHHFATLLGYGVQAICPYMAFETARSMAISNHENPELSLEKYVKAIGKGLLKVMSKIGISSLQSYSGAQIFEILGIASDVVDVCFTKSVSRLEGIGFDEIASDVLKRHRMAYVELPLGLETGGIYQWNQRGEAHMFNPDTIHFLQLSTRSNNYKVYKKYANLVNNQSEQALTLRGLLRFRKGKPIPIEEVEPVEAIFKRFSTGAMSFGSISHEAHTTLAIAMNRIGGRSNSGEGGEDESRFEVKENGDWERSAIKQVASGRFGVTSYYLSQAQELQIKMAQGAKPGEGGQLPGHKVDEWIGRVRHSTPGVGLISPPPHHDIYSIEDLAQLIFDLKNANPVADVSVKLVSKAGVGIIASGVAKAKADKILISGFDGGTGASPLSSIRHAGLPWELGLAETHQVLVKNKLRNRVTLQTDGQIRTGRDLAIAAFLGAEEFGVATASLVVEGCIMMRKCHLNTCPVGIATQDSELRTRFDAKPEYIINFFTFLAEDLREIMAEMGFRTVNEMVGKVEMLKFNENELKNSKYKKLDLSPILYKEFDDDETPQYKTMPQESVTENILDKKLIQKAKSSIELGKKSSSVVKIRNTDRAVGTMLSYEISRRFKSKGLPDNSLQFRFKGSAGQSFGGFLAKGITFTLRGESNDYFGKGLSGGILVVSPDEKAIFEPSENIIIGNVALYGATSGEAYIQGMAGARFAVRNSGATAVVEGVGDHACEYMTGGLVVVLGETGKNFAAGMSGGIAYVFDPSAVLEQNLNAEMVDLEPLSETDLGDLRRLVRTHFRLTGSRKALEILNEWEKDIPFFKKIMPRDYKISLQKKAEKLEPLEKQVS